MNRLHIRSFMGQYRKVTELPTGLNDRARTLGKVLYMIMTVCAIVMLVFVYGFKVGGGGMPIFPTFTDLIEKDSLDHAIPDIIMCPYVPKNKSVKIMSQGHPTQARRHKAFERKFKVWFLTKNLEAMNITDAQLDQLSMWKKNKTLSEKDKEALLNLPFRSMTAASLKHNKWLQSKLVAKLYQTVDKTLDESKLEAIWIFLATITDFELENYWHKNIKPPKDPRFPRRKFLCYPRGGAANSTDVLVRMAGAKNLWCFFWTRTIWMEDHQCLLFPVHMIGKRTLRNFNFYYASHPYHDLDKRNQYASDGFGIMEWFGNLEMTTLHLDYFWPIWMHEDGECHGNNHLRAYYITNEADAIFTKCQDPAVFGDNEFFQNCTPRQVTQYWEYVPILEFDCVQFPFKTITQVLYITVKQSQTTIQKMQLVGGVLGFATGFSVMQIIEFLAGWVKNTNRKWLLRIMRALLMTVLLGISLYLTVINLNNLLAESTRYTRTQLYVQLDEESAVLPSLELFGYNKEAIFWWNHTKLVRHNVSVELLSFITSVAGLNKVDNERYYSLLYEDHEFNRKYNESYRTVLQSAPDAQRLLKLKREMELIEHRLHQADILADPSYLTEYKRVARELDLDVNEQPYKVYESFVVDSCQLVHKCKFGGEIVPNCCKYVRFEAHQAWVIDEAFVLHLPAEYKMFKQGDTHALEVFFDTSVVKESNFAYYGAAEYNFVRKVKLTRGIKFVAAGDYCRVPFRVIDRSSVDQATHTLIGDQFFNTVGNLEKSGMVLTAGLSVRRVHLLLKNSANNCRKQDAGCRVNSHAQKKVIRSDMISRATAEITNCGCYICMSHSFNTYIEDLLQKRKKCCTAEQASECLSRKINCCERAVFQLEDVCCFTESDYTNDPDTKCTTNQTSIQRALQLHRKLQREGCDLDYEIFNTTAVIKGSDMAEKITDEHRKEYARYMEHCSRPICDRRSLINTKYILGKNKDTDGKKYFVVKIYLTEDSVVTIIETDRFNAMEATAESLAGIGVIIGLSLLTLVDLILTFILGLCSSNSGDDAGEQSKSVFRKTADVAVSRLKRGLYTFKSIKVTPTQAAVPADILLVQRGVQNEPLPDQVAEEVEEQPYTLFDLSRDLLMILAIIVSAGFGVAALKILHNEFTNNSIANFEWKMNGTTIPPSMAICVESQLASDLRRLFVNSTCRRQGEPTSCESEFNQEVRLSLSAKNYVFCQLNDQTKYKRMHNKETKRRFEDFNLLLATNHTVKIWIGNPNDLKDGKILALNEWDKGTYVQVYYAASVVNSIRDCTDQSPKTNCSACNVSSLDKSGPYQCCPINTPNVNKPVTDVLVSKPKLSCRRYIYSLDKVLNGNVWHEGQRFVLYDWYGVVEKVTYENKYSTATLLASLGMVVDTFLGMTMLSILCVFVYVGGKLKTRFAGDTVAE